MTTNYTLDREAFAARLQQPEPSLSQALEAVQDTERRAATDLIYDLAKLRRLLEVEPDLVHLLDSAEKAKAARQAFETVLDAQLTAKRQAAQR